MASRSPFPPDSDSAGEKSSFSNNDIKTDDDDNRGLPSYEMAAASADPRPSRLPPPAASSPLHSQELRSGLPPQQQEQTIACSPEQQQQQSFNSTQYCYGCDDHSHGHHNDYQQTNHGHRPHQDDRCHHQNNSNNDICHCHDSYSTAPQQQQQKHRIGGPIGAALGGPVRGPIGAAFWIAGSPFRLGYKGVTAAQKAHAEHVEKQARAKGDEKSVPEQTKAKEGAERG